MWQNEFLEGARKHGVDMEIVKKDESQLMRFLGWLLFFCPNFENFVTTMRRKVYVPSFEALGMETMAHEMQHVWDWSRMKLWYTFIYTWPQNFALLSLLSFWSLWWLLCLLFLLPLPSPGRMWIERRGYLMTLLVLKWKRGMESEKDDLMRWRLERKDRYWVISQFVGSSYYFMWPFQSNLESWFEVEVARNVEPKEDWMIWVKDFVIKNRAMTW
jgi:hypothetical protein